MHRPGAHPNPRLPGTYQELAGSAAARAPLAQEVAGVAEDGDPAVTVAVGHVHLVRVRVRE